MEEEVLTFLGSPGIRLRLLLSVYDLSYLNDHLDIPTFRMDTAERIRRCLHQGFWVTPLDLSDAYFHIPVHPSYRRFLRFQIEDFYYQFRALLFGIATAPWLFTKVVLEVNRIVHTWGIELFQYLDDWLIQAESEELCHQYTLSVLTLCSELGLIVNLRKSELQLADKFAFLGRLHT